MLAGDVLALVLRLVFICSARRCSTSFHITFYVFGAAAPLHGCKLARHDDIEIEPERNPAAPQRVP